MVSGVEPQNPLILLRVNSVRAPSGLSAILRKVNYMQTIQKAGFVISNSIFIALGLVFLIIGIIAKDRTLMIMGAV
jgi:hypothetical protein